MHSFNLTIDKFLVSGHGWVTMPPFILIPTNTIIRSRGGTPTILREREREREREASTTTKLFRQVRTTLQGRKRQRD